MAYSDYETLLPRTPFHEEKNRIGKKSKKQPIHKNRLQRKKIFFSCGKKLPADN